VVQQRLKLDRYGINAVISEYIARILVFLLLIAASGDSR